MKDQKFESILKNIRDSLMRKSSDELKKIKDTDFETYVFNELKKENEKLKSSNIEPIYEKNSHKFPDIGYGIFGIEVKTVESDKWVCAGNSIMEGTAREGVKKIYVFFLKKGAKHDIKYKKYEECISDIITTHSPRYEINMDIQQSETVFENLKISYSNFRKSTEKIKKLREYYREKKQQIWWLDEKTGESTSPLKMKSFSEIPKLMRDSYLVEIFSLFPEVYSSDFDGPVAHLVSKYSVYSKNFRDEISAGGKICLKWNGVGDFCISRIFFNFWQLKPKVFSYLCENRKEVEEFLGSHSKNIDIKYHWIDLVEARIKENRRLIFPEGKSFKSLLEALDKGKATFEE
ncbi:MAG: hypothetical protein ACYCTV_05290 [Leptospirales bacterium]